MPDEAWLLVNPTAGGGRSASYASIVGAALSAADIAHRVIRPESAADTTRWAAQAVEQGATAVVACGGDGTVHSVLQPLVDTPVALGVVAAGSGDDVAAGLGLTTGDPHAIGAALVTALANGRHRLVDVGAAATADGTRRYFLGVLSTGFDSSVNERANTMSRLGGQRYNVAIVRELASFRPLAYDVVIDGTRLVAPGMLVSVGNGPQYGGGMRVCPAAEPDDGLLDVTWLDAMSKVAFLRVFPTVYSGGHVRHPAVRTYRGRAMTIATPGQVAYADGERIGPLPVDIEVRPAALRVLSG